MSGLKRTVYPIPAQVQSALETQGLLADYLARPAYQQNDYIGWITRAKTPATYQKRLDQMLAELRQGGIYMNMRHLPSTKP